MKTLYININGENIQSNADLHVVGRPEDALINAFYYELGNEMLNGVPGVSRISKRDLVLEFKNHDKNNFAKILDQWSALKKIVLGPNPSGQFGVELPDDYVKWLKDKSDRVYRTIAMSIVDRGRKVNICVDNIYEAIELLLDSIDPDDCSDCEQFVINDELITTESRIVIDYKSHFDSPLQFITIIDFKKPKDQDTSSGEDNASKPHNSTTSVYAKVRKGIRGEEIAKFYYSDGREVSKSEFYIVASTKDDHINKNLLVMKTEGDTTLYYVSSDGELHVIGDYDLEAGYRDGIYYSDKKWWRYTVEVINDTFILYRNDKFYKLFRICDNCSIHLISEFSSKAILWSQFKSDGLIIIGDYIVDMVNGFTLCHRNGKEITVKGYDYACLIGFQDDELIFLASTKDEWDFADLRGLPIVNQRGDIKKNNFNFDQITIFNNNFIAVYNDSKSTFGLINPIGSIILPCQFDSISQVTDKVFKITARDGDEMLFIASLTRSVEFYNDYMYWDWDENKTSLSIFRTQDDTLLRTFSGNYSLSEFENVFFEHVFDYAFGIIPKELCFVPINRHSLLSLSSNNIFYTWSKANREEIIGINEFFAISGTSYIELFDKNGYLLYSFDHGGTFQNMKCWPNGYISYKDDLTNVFGYIDREGKRHDIDLDLDEVVNGNGIIHHNEGVSIISDNCIAIVLRMKPSPEYEFNLFDYYVFVDSTNQIIFKGAKSFDTIDGNHIFCSSNGFSTCIIDTKLGRVAMAIENSSNEMSIYLVK